MDPFQLVLKPSVRTDLDLENLYKHIRANGIEDPILVCGREVIDGLRRVLCARLILSTTATPDEEKMRVVTVPTQQVALLVQPIDVDQAEALISFCKSKNINFVYNP